MNIDGRQFVLSTKVIPNATKVLIKMQKAFELRSFNHYFVLSKARVAQGVEQFHFYIHMVFPTNVAQGYVN